MICHLHQRFTRPFDPHSNILCWTSTENNSFLTVNGRGQSQRIGIARIPNVRRFWKYVTTARNEFVVSSSWQTVFVAPRFQEQGSSFPSMNVVKVCLVRRYECHWVTGLDKCRDLSLLGRYNYLVSIGSPTEDIVIDQNFVMTRKNFFELVFTI